MELRFIGTPFWMAPVGRLLFYCFCHIQTGSHFGPRAQRVTTRHCSVYTSWLIVPRTWLSRETKDYIEPGSTSISLRIINTGGCIKDQWKLGHWIPRRFFEFGHFWGTSCLSKVTLYRLCNCDNASVIFHQNSRVTVSLKLSRHKLADCPSITAWK